MCKKKERKKERRDIKKNPLKHNKRENKNCNGLRRKFYFCNGQREDISIFRFYFCTTLVVESVISVHVIEDVFNLLY